MKRYKSVLVVVSIIIFIFLGFVYKKPSENIKVGAILALTGSTSSFYGENNKKSLDLMAEQINSNGGINGHKIEIIYEDSQADKTIAVTLAQKLVAQGVKYIISDVSAVSVAIAPILEKAEVVLIATATSNPNLTTAGDYIFRNKYSSALEGVAAAKYIANTLKPRTVAFLYQNSDYGVGVYNMFSKEIEQSNVQVVLAEKYSKDQTSFNSELTKIKELKSDVLILAGFPKEIGLAIKQARELGIDSQMFAHSGSVGSDLYQAAGIHADGLINLTELDNTESNKSYQEFKEIFLNKFGSSPDLINSLAYDALGILVTGLESCNKNISAQCVRDEIKNLKNYAGVTGLTTFDQNGDPMDRGLICVKKNITLDAENKLVIKDVSCLE